MYKDYYLLQWTFIVLIIASGFFVNVTRNGRKGVVLKVVDKGTITLFRLLYPLGIMTAFGMQFWSNFSLIGWIQAETLCVVGTTLFISGMALRWSAILRLNNAFTVKISILENHQLITNGAFRFIRHPSYTGLLLYYAGLGLLMGNLISFLVLITMNVVVLIPRIKLEETALSEHFGIEWETYANKTYRLIPFVF
jgi:protein-S-isoprenylcysteine O-methyltransferase